MRSKLFYSILTLSILLVLGSCSQNKKNQHEGLSPTNPKVAELDAIPDSAMLVKLETVFNGKISVRTIDGNEKKTYDYTEAAETGKVKGSLTLGDTLSIFPEARTRKVLMAINVSELSGRWFYDMAQHRGMIFEKTGAMSSINSATISYREWKLINGQLYIYYVDMQQPADERHQYLVEEADITSLNRENLELIFRGNAIKCKRQHQVIKFHI